MDTQRIDMFLMNNAKYFSPEHFTYIRSELEKLDDTKFFAVQTVSYKDPTIMLIISLLGGGLGIDRFLLGETGLGIAKLVTCGGLGIWTIVDWFLIMNMTRDFNLKKFQMALAL